MISILDNTIYFVKRKANDIIDKTNPIS